MIKLFNIENYNIDMKKFSHILHDECVTKFENTIADYVGAKYACGVNSATNAIFLSMLNKDVTVNIPSMIPAVVPNALLTSGNSINFIDDTEWVGDSYTLHDFGDYKIIDSAQKIEKDQYKNEANDSDIMIFSFYPTKPIGSIDGGMVVSNDEEKINWFREATLNGMSFATDNWERKIKFPGYKMYLNSVQAYVANENFKKYESKLANLNRIRKIYNSEFGLSNTSNHLYRVPIIDSTASEKSAALRELNIASGIHYECLHKHATYAREKFEFGYTHNSLPKSDAAAGRVLSIPFHEKLSDEEINRVIEGTLPSL